MCSSAVNLFDLENRDEEKHKGFLLYRVSFLKFSHEWFCEVKKEHITIFERVHQLTV
jgi:hypothetical protein